MKPYRNQTKDLVTAAEAFLWVRKVTCTEDEMKSTSLCLALQKFSLGGTAFVSARSSVIP